MIQTNPSPRPHPVVLGRRPGDPAPGARAPEPSGHAAIAGREAPRRAGSPVGHVEGATTRSRLALGAAGPIRTPAQARLADYDHDGDGRVSAGEYQNERIAQEQATRLGR